MRLGGLLIRGPPRPSSVLQATLQRPRPGLAAHNGGAARAASDRRRFAMTLRLTGLLAIVAGLVLVASASAGPGTTQLGGSMTSLPDEVIGSVYYFHAHVAADAGSPGLDGDWYQPVFDLATGTPLLVCHEQPSTVQCDGTERFDGFFDRNGNGVKDAGEESGTLEFTYDYSASASGNGRCHHPLTGATGGFAGATGQLTMKDRVGACGEVVTTYKGHLSLSP